MDRKRLKQKFEAEMQLALEDEQRGELELAFRHLERAHILGQRWLTRHWRSHWAMLRVAKAKRESKEVRGQITRLAAVPLGWLTGWVPKGNTGGANVNPLKPMPYPPELAAEFSGYRVWRDVALRGVVLAGIVFAVRLAG